MQPVQYFKNIRTDFEKSIAAHYVASLVDRITQVGEVDKNVFEYLQTWLEYVNFHSSVFNLILLDGFIVKLLYCLGFSITHSPDIDNILMEYTEILENGSWESISQLKYNSDCHKKIYDFLVYQTEKKVSDWGKLACFNGKW